MSEDEEFADFFDQCTMVEDGAIENQAANLSEMASDPRTLITGDALKEECNRNVGQLVVKYELDDDAEDGKSGMRSATGVVIKDLGDDRYVVMTSCYPFVTSADGETNVTAGQFFLQRSDVKKCAALYLVEPETVTTYPGFEMSESSPAEGKDIALCVVKYDEKQKNGDKEALGDIDTIKSSSQDDYKENEFYVGGYPHQAIKENEGMSQSRYFHYGMSGKIQDMKLMDGDTHAILIHSTDCSPGQNGAPLYVTNEDGDKFIGAIHSGQSHFEDCAAGASDYYTATVITQHLYESFILPTIQGF